MRPCQHPHKDRGGRQLAAIPMTPIERCQLILDTETGVVPYCGIDNERALAAANVLGQRYTAAGVCTGYSIVRGDHWTGEHWTVPHMVLSMALAEREERFCVADDIRCRLATYLHEVDA